MSTIKEQIAAIPRPTYEAMEVGESSVLFNIAKRGIKRPVEPVRKPREHVEPALPAYEPPTIKSKIVQWIEDAPIRRQDSWDATDLYGELKAKRKRETLFLRAASLGLLDTGHDSYKRQLNALVKKQGV